MTMLIGGGSLSGAVMRPSVRLSVCPSPELKTVHLGHGYNRTLIVLEVEPSDHRK